MTQHTWAFDAPTGVYKSHTMSGELLRAAIEETVVAPFARTQSDFGRKAGESITMTRVSNIAEPTSPVLSEVMRIPEDNLTLSTKSITVQEIGRAVPYTSLSGDLSEFDIENAVQRELTKQMRLALDTLAATAVKSGAIKYTPTGLTSSTVTTNSAFSTSALANLNVYHLEEIRDLMYDTYQIPGAVGDDYIGIFRTLGIRGVKRDPAWEEWHKYTDPQSKFNSEVGRIERIRLIETNHARAFSKVGTGSVLGEGVVFGEDAFALAEAVPPELRAAMPDDFGRSRAVAWYGVLKYDVIWETANAGEARIVHVGST
jgi:N4-gp56 family major capsid protein